MNFCSSCGAGVALAIPDGDNRERYVCSDCNTIHYSNPNIVAGCIVEHGDRLLMCKRGIEPRRGYWTMPAGFMENGETVAAAAARETLEEANARVEIDRLLGVYSIPHISQVHMMFRGTLLNEDFGPGEESLECALYTEDEIPWDDLSFRVTTLSLRHYYEDKKAGRTQTRIDQIVI